MSFFPPLLLPLHSKFYLLSLLSFFFVAASTTPRICYRCHNPSNKYLLYIIPANKPLRTHITGSDHFTSRFLILSCTRNWSFSSGYQERSPCRLQQTSRFEAATSSHRHWEHVLLPAYSTCRDCSFLNGRSTRRPFRGYSLHITRITLSSFLPTVDTWGAGLHHYLNINQRSYPTRRTASRNNIRSLSSTISNHLFPVTLAPPLQERWGMRTGIWAEIPNGPFYKFDTILRLRVILVISEAPLPSYYRQLKLVHVKISVFMWLCSCSIQTLWILEKWVRFPLKVAQPMSKTSELDKERQPLWWVLQNPLIPLTASEASFRVRYWWIGACKGRHHREWKHWRKSRTRWRRRERRGRDRVGQ